MKRKSFKPPHIAPLQRLTAREITDPAEQAAVLAEIKRRELAAERAANGKGSEGNGLMRKKRAGKARKGV
jgi:hypothetical protein